MIFIVILLAVLLVGILIGRRNAPPTLPGTSAERAAALEWMINEVRAVTGDTERLER